MTSVWPGNQESSLEVQAVATQYLNLPRAVATAILYRYARINVGYGIPLTEQDLQDARAWTAGSENSEIELAKRTMGLRRDQECHASAVQNILAQWLTVYAGMQHEGNVADDPACGFLGIRIKPRGAQVANDTGAFRNNIDGILQNVATGNVFVAPVVILAFLVEWFGASQSVLNGRSDVGSQEAWKLLRANASALTVLHMPAESPVFRYFKQGLAISGNALFVNVLNDIFDFDASSHGFPVHVNLVRGAGRLQTFEVQKEAETISAATHCYNPKLLYAHREEKTNVCTEVSVSPELLSGPNSSQQVFVMSVRQGPRTLYHPVLQECTDAPLQRLSISASIARFVGSLSASEYNTRLLKQTKAQMWLLYPRYDRKDIASEVHRVFRLTYGDLVADDDSEIGERRQPVKRERETVKPPARAEPQIDEDLEDDLTRYLTETRGKTKKEVLRAGFDDLDEPKSKDITGMSLIQTIASTPLQQPAAPVPVPIDVSSTVTVALADPRPFKPKRWFTKGPANVTLYYSSQAWKRPSNTLARKTTNAFFKQVQVARHKDTDSMYIVRDGVAAANIEPVASQPNEYVIQRCLKRVSPSRLMLKTGNSQWTAVFRYHDLLWIAVNNNDRSREIILKLLKKHHNSDDRLRRFDNDITEQLLTEACQATLETCRSWKAGAIAELTFEASDEKAAALLDELDVLHTSSVVFNTDEEPDRLFYGKRIAGSELSGRYEFIPRNATGFIMRKLKTPVVSTKQHTESQPATRGYVLTTGQLALLFSVGHSAACYALQSLTSFCLPKTLLGGNQFVYLAMVDKMEIKNRFFENNMGKVALDGISVLSLVTVS